MPTLDELVSHPPHLPVTHALSDIAAAARPGGCVVVTAPLGTGKTTLLSPTVAVVLIQYDTAVGHALVTQPHGMAARAAARQIVRLLGKEVGGQIGYPVCGDSRISERMRMEMVMPGTALRHLQRNPELPGVLVLIIDGFHERGPGIDLTLTFMLDVRSALRGDLFVALTSAAPRASRAVDFLRASTGEEPMLVDIPGDIFPLELCYAPLLCDVKVAGTIGDERMGVCREYLMYMVRTVEETVAATEGSVPVFLPGVGEIETVRGNLCLSDIPVLALYGQLSAAEQDRAFFPVSDHRIILSTPIMESSLTIPGVSVVVDVRLAQEPHFDAGHSLSSLVIVPATLARLEQRAGRAARTGPDIAVHAMDAVDAARRPAQSVLGIVTQDLADVRLQVVSWGIPVEELPLLGVPPAGTREAVRQRLSSLGAVDEAEAATVLGRTLASLPLDPPLGRALLASGAFLGTSRAAHLMVLLLEGLRVPGANLDVLERWPGRDGAGGAGDTHAQTTRVKETRARLECLAQRLPTSTPDGPLASAVATHRRVGSRTQEGELALTCALAYPEWITRRHAGSAAYILAGGVDAEPPQDSPLGGQEWLAVVSINRAPASRHARTLVAMPLSEEDALAAGAVLLETRTQTSVDKGTLCAIHTHALGAIPLKSTPASPLSKDEAVTLAVDHLAARGLDDLNWGKEASSLCKRMRVLHGVFDNP